MVATKRLGQIAKMGTLAANSEFPLCPKREAAFDELQRSSVKSGVIRR
jgi:hypothetical protein